MLLLILITIPLLGLLLISTDQLINFFSSSNKKSVNNLAVKENSVAIATDSISQLSTELQSHPIKNNDENSIYYKKSIALTVTTFTFLFSLLLFIGFDFSSNQFQYVMEPLSVTEYNFNLGLDGISIYFVLLTTFIMPVALLSN
jgi:NADH-ubiquinone oxidoreductase chain 4